MAWTRSSFTRLRDAKQLHRVAAEDRFLVGIAQERRVEDEVDADRPVEWIVGPVHQLTDPRFRHEMPQPIVAEDHRVDEQFTAEVFARLFLERLAVGAERAATTAQRIGATEVGRQISTGMGRADLESWETIERALEDQVREEHTGLERVPDRIA